MHPTPSQLGDATLDSIFETDYEGVKKARKVSGDSGKGEISDDERLVADECAVPELILKEEGGKVGADKEGQAGGNRTI